MKLKRYGMTYKGSKNKIVPWLVDKFPVKDNFYDLFCGGGAVIHGILAHTDFKNVIANDKNELCIKMLKMAINDEFKDEQRWISHEEYMKLRYVDPYVAFVFSFGGDLHSYFCSYEKEEQAKINFYRFLDEKISIDRSQPYESLIRLRDMANMPNKDRLTLLNQDYRDVEIKPNSIVYCDIPYKTKHTENYGKIPFDHNAFYDWCKKQTELTFVSSYEIPEDFISVSNIGKYQTIDKANNSAKVQEHLFIPKHQIDLYDQYKRDLL
jgi:site-specific DNA-adenine methylase